MEEKSIEQFTKLVGDFRLLTTKVQKDNQIKSKIIKESNQVLESCKKEYENLHLEQWRWRDNQKEKNILKRKQAKTSHLQ